MKLTKKLLALLLALIVVVSTTVFALEFPDVKADDANREAIDVLSSLGIIKGYEDGQFRPDKEVTRAELTSLLMRLQNLSLTGVAVADTGYTDVPSTHWAVYDIKTASGMGIIKGFGDGTFGPEAMVTFEQAVKMVVAMLGYESQAIVKGGWPNGYVAQGRELGLLKKAEMVQTAPAPRKIIAQLLYNALEVDLMQETASSTPEKPSYEILNDRNVMTEYMKIEKVIGVVTANPYSTLTSGESDLLSDEIQIKSGSESEKYKLGLFPSAVDLLGLDVVAYVKYDDNHIFKEIKHIATKGEVKEVIIPATELTTVSTTQFAIENKDTGRTTSYKVDTSKMNIIYNGKYIDTDYAYEKGLVKPEIGTVTLVDSGSGYNLVRIDSYTNYVVKSVDVTDKKIYVDTTLSDGRTDVNVPYNDTFDYNVSIKKNDKDIELSAIKKGNIISVKENISDVQKGIMNIEILVSDVKKTGKVKGDDGEGNYTIENDTYKISPSLNGTDIKKQIVYNANGTFYIDAFGNIANVEFAAAATYNYGYILRARATTKDGETVGAVKLYDYKSKSFKTLYFADKLDLDGVRKSDHSTIVEELQEISKNELQDRAKNKNVEDGAQPIKYLLNSAGKISEINTVDTSNEKDSDVYFKVSAYNSNAKYTSSNRTFSIADGKKATIDTKTIVFYIPDDRNEENKYAIKNYSYFISGVEYDIEIVETTSSGTVATMLVYETNPDAKVHYKSPLIVVSEINEVYEDGEEKTQVVGFDLTTGTEKKYYVGSEADISNVGSGEVSLEKGDIIRFGVDLQGNINNNIHLYLDASEAASGKHPSVLESYSKDKLADNNTYPIRRVRMHNNVSDPFYSSDMVLTETFTSGYSFVYGTPLNAITDDTNTIIFTDLVKGEDGYTGVSTEQSTSLIIPAKTAFYVYNSGLTETNMLKVVPSSDSSDRTSNILEIKTVEAVGDDDCDNIFIYAIDGTVKAVYVIK